MALWIRLVETECSASDSGNIKCCFGKAHEPAHTLLSISHQNLFMRNREDKSLLNPVTTDL